MLKSKEAPYSLKVSQQKKERRAMNNEEVDRHLLILTETVKAFDACQEAMQLASTLPLKDHQEVILDHWRRGRQAERQYNSAIDWLNEHHVSYVFDKQQKRYVELSKTHS
jgi:uncharacterized protein YbaP (TraB family)